MNGDFLPMTKPNFDDKRMQKHDDKFNKNNERNRKLLNQFFNMCRYSYVNDLKDEVDFGLSIMENVESGSASENKM